MRRYLIISAIGLLVIGVLFAVYVYFFTGGSGVAVTPSGTLPVAGQGNQTTNTGTASGTTNPGTPEKVSARLVRIDAGPVVPGEVATDVGTSSPDINVSYIERESGNVFSYLVHTGVLTRTNNTTVPRLQSALWLPDASFALVQYLSGDISTLNTYALPATNTKSGFFLPQNLSGLAVSSSAILALASGVNGSVAEIEHTDGTHVAQAFTTPLSDVRVGIAGKNYVAVTKSAATLEGDAYLVDASGRFSRIAGPLMGLSALVSPSGKYAFVSYTGAGTLKTELVTVATGVALPLPLTTIADKCVWAADDSAVYCGVPTSVPAGYAYPDDWYQGAVHFSDKMWKVDVAGRYAELVLDFSSANAGSLDATNLAVDPANSVLVFLNKNDGSLWSYQL